MAQPLHEHKEDHPHIHEELQDLYGKHLALLSVITSLIHTLSHNQKGQILEQTRSALHKVSTLDVSDRDSSTPGASLTRQLNTSTINGLQEFIDILEQELGRES